MEEIWKDIKGYESLYQISNWGRVKSLGFQYKGRWGNTMFRKGKIINQQEKTGGYLYVCLSKNGVHEWFRVNRLVGLHFIPIPERLKNIPIDKLDVGHLKPLPDGTEDKTANEVWNLAWMNKSENGNYGTRIKRISEKQINKNTSKQVYQYDLNNNLINVFPSGKEVQRQLGYLQTSISGCCRGKYKTAYGYKWRYKQESVA